MTACWSSRIESLVSLEEKFGVGGTIEKPCAAMRAEEMVKQKALSAKQSSSAMPSHSCNRASVTASFSAWRRNLPKPKIPDPQFHTEMIVKHELVLRGERNQAWPLS